MMFKSGYTSKTHKHADDNSFMLYSKGYDLFVDPGWYNYTTGDRYRDYFNSALAHNTVIVDGKSYSPTVENSHKVGIYDYGKEENYDYVIGYNDMYDGVMIDRYYYNLGDAIIIHDNIISNEEHTYSQLFHASEFMQLVQSNNSEALFKLANTDFNVRIRQIFGDTTLNVIRGDFDKETFGYISRKINHIDQINTLKFDVKATNTNLVTLITIEDENGNVQNINNISFDYSNNKFDIDGENTYSISLTERPRISNDNITVSQENNKFEFTNNCVNENFMYAWYVIDSDKNEVVEKFDYSYENNIKYEFNKKGNYFIRSYIKNEKGQKKWDIIAKISYDDEKGEWKNVSHDYPYLSLHYKGHNYEQLTRNQYKFKVDYDYSLNSSIRWYIYRNGIYYDVVELKNNNELEYTFNEPGTYTILYYLKTQEKNNEFWNFPIINID